MSLKVERTSLDTGIEVLTLTGSLTLGRDAQHFEWTIEEMVKNQQNRIIVDLSGVPFVDSAGIGILVGCHGKTSSAGGQLRLAGLAERVLHVLKITKVDSIVLIDANVDESVRALNAVA